MRPDDPGHPHDLLSALPDGELTAPEREQVDRHLAGCPACRDRLEDLRRLSAATAADPVPPVPADLASRIRGRIDQATRPMDAGAIAPSAAYGSGHRPFRLSPLALGAAASFLVAVIAVAIWQANRGLEPISPVSPPAGEPIASLPAPDREPIQNTPPREQERDAEGPALHGDRVEDRPTPAREPISKAPAPSGVPDTGAAVSMTASATTGTRSLTLVTDLYRAVVSEDGGVMLTSGPSYVCVIPPPEIREGIRAVPQAASPATELRQLFEQAYAVQPAAAGAQGVAAGAPDRAAESRESAAAAGDVGDRIDRLIRARYLPRAEALCGPLPAPQAAPTTPAPRE